MKIAYLSVYRDSTGYANQAVNNMLAMDSVGLDVVARSIRLSNNTNEALSNRVRHLEDKQTDGVDVVIQHILPHMFEFKSGIKNIGLFDWETTHFDRSNWPQCCNMMDEIWVPSLQNVAAAKQSNVQVPIKILPCAGDILRFNKDKQPLNIQKLKDKCVFYTIGELSRRKNIIAIIRAFYGTFTSRDNVALVIKTSSPNQSPADVTELIKKMCIDIKKSMHLYIEHDYYPPVICISDFLTDIEIDRLHLSGDVFVSASHGEAWGIPAHDAMGFSNPVILSNWGSYPELVLEMASSYWNPDTQKFTNSGDIDCGWLIDGCLTSCFGQTDSFPDLYTGNELWFEPNIEHLGSCMKSAYGEWGSGLLAEKGKAAHNRAKKFSYTNVGKIAKQLLEDSGE